MAEELRRRPALRLDTGTRRTVVRVLMSLPFLSMAWPALARRTPSATEGPFYPTPGMRFSDADNDLVKIESQVREAGGEVIILKGQVRDRNGQPVEGAHVEIWQCDVNGIYLHTADRQRAQYDRSFQGFGHVVTGPDGGYAFRTIKPVPYPGRTPHIHVKVAHGGRELTTQFYLADHPLNRRDWLFNRMSMTEQDAVTMRFNEGAIGPEAKVDVYL
jgi:protocatechuate 3,4-dioxygenase beta subunit